MLFYFLLLGNSLWYPQGVTHPWDLANRFQSTDLLTVSLSGKEAWARIWLVSVEMIWRVIKNSHTSSHTEFVTCTYFIWSFSVLLDESTRKQNLAQPACSEPGSLHPGAGIVAFLGLMTIHYCLPWRRGLRGNRELAERSSFSLLNSLL